MLESPGFGFGEASLGFRHPLLTHLPLAGVLRISRNQTGLRITETKQVMDLF